MIKIEISRVKRPKLKSLLFPPPYLLQFAWVHHHYQDQTNSHTSWANIKADAQVRIDIIATIDVYSALRNR